MYLRRVVMSWIADDQINIKHLVPEEIVDLEDINVEMPSDSDSEPEVARGKLKLNSKSDDREAKSKKAPKSNGLQQKGTDGEGPKSHKCKHCPFETKKSSNLKRHVGRLHEGMEEHKAEGNCHCIQCGFRCQKILHLRDHLLKDHKILFRQENRVFDSYEGKNRIHIFVKIDFQSVECSKNFPLHDKRSLHRTNSTDWKPALTEHIDQNP